MVMRLAACKRWRRLRRGRKRGYNLVILVILVAVMNILVAAALPVWSHVMQREKEEELIFRGLQYAEAIRRFQQLHNRQPVRLDELLEVEPRSIRQLWTDPFRDDGHWGVIIAGTRRGRNLTPDPQGRQGAQLSDEEKQEEIQPIQDVGPDRKKASALSSQGPQATGPLSGVTPVSEEKTAKTFMGSNQTNQWMFQVEMIPVVPTGLLVDSVPRLNSRTIGRPFPEGSEPGIAAGPMKREVDEQPGEDRRNRNDRRNRRNRRNPNRS